MGTHRSGPSCLWDKPDITLESYIEENPDCLGKPSLNRFGRQLPFLFKVLSVGKALSIQAHPDKVNNYRGRILMKRPILIEFNMQLL